MANTPGSIINVKKRSQVEAYVVNFGASGKAEIAIKCDFGVGRVKVDVIAPQEYKAASATNATPVWAVYINKLSGDDVPIAHYIPVQYGFVPSPDSKGYEITFDGPLRVNGITPVIQASSTNNYVYVANAVPDYTTAANNKVLIRITYYEY